MLNHTAMSLLANPDVIPAIRAQQALRLFADYDLSVPRRLPLGPLDEEYGWQAGTTVAVLGKLLRMGLLVPVGEMWMLAADFTWSPQTLAEQWQQIEAARERMALAGANTV